MEDTVASALREKLTDQSLDGHLWGAFPNTMTVDDLAEHVVAALADSGHIEVEYAVERDVITGGRKATAPMYRWEAEALIDTWDNNPSLVRRHVYYGEWDPATAEETS
ncbi:hypothetical protein [Prescottella agglutinans]|nr:hypothetical protein [Prescottella agglutinans]